ncbi:hypothetical protein PR202_ga18453 [Eleusine coracana subsp. coracana]|uniref:Pectinesterase inhibitor domain-containing protein n=1 Tax=Eleusine coracana subsp. coracana TaxID=191504 RepID=A0AAV5CT29_ELECO|nr:hypothetical protein PR202_ga18453 [Eleusine coracana subsp. coracana]
MARNSSSAPCFLLLLLLVVVPHHHQLISALALAPNPMVQSTCNSTTFYDLCVAALAGDPSSSTADVPAVIAVRRQQQPASATASFLLRPSPSYSYSSTLLRSCAAQYANASEALLAARLSVADQAYDYAVVHVSAAAEYPTVCRTLFRRRPYPLELAKREDGLRRLCTIALDIISLLLQKNA